MLHRVRVACLGLLLLAIVGPALLAQSTEELNAQASRAYSSGDFKTAAKLARKVYEDSLKTQPPNSFELATAALNLGKSLVKAGDTEEGASYIEKACDIGQVRFGERDKRVGSCRMN